MWGVKPSLILVVIGALVLVTPKLGEWLQKIPGTISKIAVKLNIYYTNNFSECSLNLKVRLIINKLYNFLVFMECDF